jgi:CBS domain-containing protein
MSPRAAWRLETFGYNPVYDYAAGKADWLAAGLPTEGNRPDRPRAAEAIDRSVPTCSPHDRIVDLASRLAQSSLPVCVVVNDHRVVQGRLRLDRLDPRDTRTAEHVMEPGPATIRADADLADARERMTSRKVSSLLVTTPEGVLLGALYNENRSP